MILRGQVVYRTARYRLTYNVNGHYTLIDDDADDWTHIVASSKSEAIALARRAHREALEKKRR